MRSKIGVLAFVGCLPVAVTAAPLLYGTAHSGSHAASILYSISPTTGAATTVGAIGFDQVDALAFAPGGTLYGVGQNGAGKWTLLKIDLTTGAGTAVGATGLDVRFQDIAFGSGGSLFGYSTAARQRSKTGNVYSIDPNSGTAKFLGNLPGAADDTAPVALSSANSLYAVNAGSLGIVNGASSSTATALHYSPSFGSAPSAAKAVEYDAQSGKLWALMDQGNRGDYLATIDVKTGNVAPVGKTTAALQSIAVEPRDMIPPPPVPAPSSLLLLATGMLALAGWSRWSRSRRPGRGNQGTGNSA